jgi:hypothetical protein
LGDRLKGQRQNRQETQQPIILTAHWPSPDRKAMLDQGGWYLNSLQLTCVSTMSCI